MQSAAPLGAALCIYALEYEVQEKEEDHSAEYRPKERHDRGRTISSWLAGSHTDLIGDPAADERADDTHHDVPHESHSFVGTDEKTREPACKTAKDDPKYDIHIDCVITAAKC